MPRYHATSAGNIPFTAAEEIERDNEEAQHALDKIEHTKTDYQRSRAAAYPPITDYIDGIVKGDTTQVQEYIDACLAVKTKYPKLE